MYNVDADIARKAHPIEHQNLGESISKHRCDQSSVMGRFSGNVMPRDEASRTASIAGVSGNSSNSFLSRASSKFEEILWNAVKGKPSSGQDFQRLRCDLVVRVIKLDGAQKVLVSISKDALNRIGIDAFSAHSHIREDAHV